MSAWIFPLNAKVAYASYYEDSPERLVPWRVIARHWTQHREYPDLLRYTIEPWDLQQHPIEDRRYDVMEAQLRVWVEEASCLR